MKYTKKPVIVSLLCLWVAALAAQPTANKNYVITNIIKCSGITSQGQVDSLAIATQGKVQTVAYFDGLGRPLQTVVVKGSPSQKDIISPVQYDAFGRQVRTYLPYTDTVAGYGGFKTNWATNQPSFYNGILQGVDTSSAPYSQTILEASPLSRLLARGAPGTAWQPNLADAYDTTRKVVKMKYEISKASDSVRIFNVDSVNNISSPGYYAAGQLTINTSIDEHNGVIKTYSDKYGHVLLKRTFIDADSLQTSYIYNDLGLLTAVIQPEGMAAITTEGSWTPDGSFIDKWMFLYRYDDRSRVVMKKVPGADSVLMVYDQWDRLVLSQDGNQRHQNNWLFTKYDMLNRAVVTGLFTDSRSQDSLRNAVAICSIRNEMLNAEDTVYRSARPTGNPFYTLYKTFPSSDSYTLTLLTIGVYDSYDNYSVEPIAVDFTSEHGVTATNNFVRGMAVANLTAILGTNTWLWTVPYYDDKYRVIQQSNTNNVGGADRATNVLTFDGKMSQQYQSHTSSFFSTALTSNVGYTYDHADRILTITHQVDSQAVVTLDDNVYNELGHLLNKKIHQTASWASYLQKLDFSYNIRGWLNGINQPYSDGTGYDESDLFNLALHYNTTNLSGATAQYNGNISEQVWKGGYDEYLRGFEYTYDKANRMITANYGFKYLNDYNSTVWDFSRRFNEQVDGYDRNGNIQRFERYHGSWDKIDDLNYSYDANKLLKITDGVYTSQTVGFTDVNLWFDDYRYDQNGNLTFDLNKGIDTIHYNHLNLADSVHVSGKGFVKYVYDATGNKLQKTVTDTTGGATKTTTYKYDGAYVYKNDTLELVSHLEGRLRPLKIDTTQGFAPSNLRYTYDYFIKDHLGNVRMVLTTEQQTSLYAATLEPAAATKEEQLFTNLSSTRYAKPAGFDTDTSNHEVARLNGNIGTTGNYRVGPSLIIKVMAGDTVSIATRAWYSGSTQAPPSGLSPIADELVSLLTGGLEGAGATHGGATPTGDISDGVSDIIPFFLDNSQTYDSSRPKAFLNWMVVDEEFKRVSSTNHMGAVQVPTISGGDTNHALIGPSGLVVRRNGWLYVYVSNESNMNVYFDNIVVNHKHGPVVEQSDYYAFGLEIPGLSSQANTANNYAENRYKYNGKEMQDKEFKDGSGLVWEDYGARMYDPQIGRWMVSDPLADISRAASPYNYANNNPIRFIDPTGMRSEDEIDQEWMGRNSYGFGPPSDGDYYNSSGEKIGTDGINDHKAYLVEDKKDASKIEKNTKNGTTTQVSDLKSAKSLPSKTGLQEADNVLNATVKGGGLREHSSLVMKDGVVVKGAVGPEPHIDENGIMVSPSTVPAIPGKQMSEDVELTIHSHSTEFMLKDGQYYSESALAPSNVDLQHLPPYNTTNVIVGGLGSGSIDLHGDFVNKMPAKLGAVFYDRNMTYMYQLTQKVLERIINQMQ